MNENGKTQRRNAEFLLALAETIKQSKTLSQQEFVRCINSAATRTGNTMLNHQSDGSDSNLRSEVKQLGEVLAQMGLYDTKSRKNSVFSLTFVKSGLIKANLRLDQLREILKDANSLKKFQKEQNQPDKVVVVKKPAVMKPSHTDVVRLSREDTEILDLIVKIVDFFNGIDMESLGKILTFNSTYRHKLPITSLVGVKEYVWKRFSAFFREDRGQIYVKNLEARERATRMCTTLYTSPSSPVMGKFMALLPDKEIFDSLKTIPQVKHVKELVVPGGIMVHAECEFEDSPKGWTEASLALCPIIQRGTDVENNVLTRLMEIQSSVLDNRDLKILLFKRSLDGINDPHRLRAISNALVTNL